MSTGNRLSAGPHSDSEIRRGPLGRVDISTICITILIGIGSAVIIKLPRDKVMVAAAVIWCVEALPAMWQLVMG